METVGYVAYASLVIMAIVWTIDLRNNLGAETAVILRAVYFVSAAVLVPAFEVNMGHSLWLVPFGCLFARLIAPILIKTPVISVPFILVAGAFERIVHIGVPRDKVLAAQSAAKQASVDVCCMINRHN